MYWPCGIPRIYAYCSSIDASPREGSNIPDGSGYNGDLGSGTEDEPPSSSKSFRKPQKASGSIRDLKVSRNDQIFVTITDSTLAVWQSRPTAVLAAITRSPTSLETYGSNVSLMLRPDSAVAVIQTANSFLLTYSIATDPQARVYQQNLGQSQTRRQSIVRQFGDDESIGLREVTIGFRMAIRIDAGISKALALDQELLVATIKPAAVQCIQWSPDKNGRQTITELIGKLDWMPNKSTVREIVHERAMNLSVWVTHDLRAYAVQRLKIKEIPNSEASDESEVSERSENARRLFHGYCFHDAVSEKDGATLTAINARFSIIAISCKSGEIIVYSVRDYFGNIAVSHKLTPPASFSSTGSVTALSYSPDGYCLFVAYEKGWATWSVFGKPCGDSFNANPAFNAANNEAFLQGVNSIAWLGAGSEILLTVPNDERIWKLDMARSAAVGCFSCANLVRAMLQTPSEIVIYRGHDLPDLMTISGEASLWHHALYPPLRLYSRELELGRSTVLHTEPVNAPVIFIGPSGEDSLLVYTYENILYHYIINVTARGVSLVQVGNIAFHGMVRAPARVRAVSWILPESQLRNGDPSHDVAVASILFLNDDKLVLLQPSETPEGSLKYEMRVIAQHIEYYILMRDQLSFNFATPPDESLPASPSVENALNGSHSHHSLQDSLWTFSGNDLKMWNDVQDVLRMALEGPLLNNLALLSIPVDFYPLSILLSKGVVLGIESEMIQRRDVPFTMLRFGIRTHLFIPYLIRHQLSQNDTHGALSLAHQYEKLSYFAHALEVLLHNVLDDEVDLPPQKGTDDTDADNSPRLLLPAVLTFLQTSLTLSDYLSTIVQCTRKTELRSWKTLFAYLPTPQELFEQAIQLNALKTAGGYLLVLQGLDEDEDEEGSEQRIEPHVIRLLGLGKDNCDWDLCTELAGFMLALDPTGNGLRRVLDEVGFHDQPNGQDSSSDNAKGLGLTIPPTPTRRTTTSSSTRTIVKRGYSSGASSPALSDDRAHSPKASSAISGESSTGYFSANSPGSAR
ncbi:MAG: hypothetical protein Q9160_000160 [Pyrenula sp. 1 TL-2023]